VKFGRYVNRLTFVLFGRIARKSGEATLCVISSVDEDRRKCFKNRKEILEKLITRCRNYQFAAGVMLI